MALGTEEIEHRFGFHKATVEGPNATASRHADMRKKFRDFAEELDAALPDGRDKALVMTKLQEASMWTHWAIAQDAPLVKE